LSQAYKQRLKDGFADGDVLNEQDWKKLPQFQVNLCTYTCWWMGDNECQ
jgi:hypothetical protein